MVTLERIKYETDGNTSVACLTANFDGKKKTYSISTDSKTFVQCNIDRADSFLPLIFLEAAENESDIIVQNHVSNELLFSMNEYILPVIATAFKKRCIRVYTAFSGETQNSDVKPKTEDSNAGNASVFGSVVSFMTHGDRNTEKITIENPNSLSGTGNRTVTIKSELRQSLFVDHACTERLMKIFSAGLFLGDNVRRLTVQAPEQRGNLKYLSDYVLDYLAMFAKTFSTSYVEFMIDCRDTNRCCHGDKTGHGITDKIIIGKLHKSFHDGKVRLGAMVSLAGKEEELYYEVEPELEEYLVDDRIDAFVVMLLAFALRNGLDIESSEPISAEIHRKLTNHFIPAVSLHLNSYSPISLNIPQTDTGLIGRDEICGAGFSGGVDSMYTFAKNYYRTDRYKISHLAIFNAGVFECSDPNAIFVKAMENAGRFAEDLGISVIGVTSNIDDIVRTPYHNECTFRLFACAMSIGKFWGNYMISSSKSLEYLGFCESYADSYELLMALCFSTHYLTFHTFGEDLKRYEKIKYLAETDPVFCDNLHPCVHNPVFGEDNCGSCPKCYRMMFTLDKLGKLDRFRKAFPLDYYEKHRNEIEAKVFSSSLTNSFDEELMEDLVSDHADEETARRVKALAAVKKMIKSNRQNFVDKGKEGGIITEKYIYESETPLSSACHLL